jgi:CheY-like chemotaxis protein
MAPTAVGGGMAAMDALWHGVANGRPYALMLLDAWMPDQDGFTIAAMVRERAQLANTRIIMLTSSVRPNNPGKVGELRLDGHLLKPLRREELLETIYRVMSTTQEVERDLAISLEAPRPLLRPLRILVAEDNEMSALVIEQLLVRGGHDVKLATTGGEALRYARDEAFDVALIDVHMPELDGLEVVQALRQLETGTTRHLPVIALTARTRKEDRDRCLAAGMDEFLTKPIRAADVWAAIGRVSQGGHRA